MLKRVLRVFFNKSSSDTSDSLDAIEEELAPKLAAHQDAIQLNPVLFNRIKSLYENRESESGPRRARTVDPRIKSPLLYRLSYRPHCNLAK
jgi:Zn-dependent oligopeptidase